MKSPLSVSLSLLCACLFLSSCSDPEGISFGFDGFWIGELPYVHFGVKSEQTIFDVDDVSLEFSYGNTGGNTGGYIGINGSDGMEDAPIICVAVYFSNSKYLDQTFWSGEPFYDYKEIENLYFVKEISVDDYNENYNVDNNFWRRKYEHSETLTIPKETFELTSGYTCIVVTEIAYSSLQDRYLIAGGGYQHLKYEKLDEYTVKLSKPTGSPSDPQ